ncbi:hypothetical protein ACQP2X_30605 [Actinoplanes sp. CA-131856]
MPIDDLYVARDDTTTIVSRRRFRVGGTRSSTARWGGVEETVSVRQSPLPALTPRGFAAVVVPPGLTVGALWLAGVGAEIVVGAGVAVFLAGAYLNPLLSRLRPAAKRARPPADQPFRTLFDEPERQRFGQALDVARALSATWPELAGLVDRREAVWALNQALWDIADLLAGHQEIRRLAESLDREGAGGGPLTGELSRTLAGQLAEARGRLRRLDDEVTSRIAALETAESAGRGLVREMRLIEAMREAARSLGEQPAAPAVDPGAELAERTTAVIDAYRELSPDFRPPG